MSYSENYTNNINYHHGEELTQINHCKFIPK